MADQRPRRKRSFLVKLKDKYRLSLVNESSFEERMSFRLSRMNVILLTIALFTLHGALVTALIVFTPLKRHIPGRNRVGWFYAAICNASYSCWSFHVVRGGRKAVTICHLRKSPRRDHRRCCKTQQQQCGEENRPG